MIIYARKNMIFHVYDVNLVQNSDVSDLSLTLTAYNFFPVHFSDIGSKGTFDQHKISFRMVYKTYIFERTKIFVFSASGHIWWRHKNPEIRTLPVIFRLEAKFFRNPREISYKKTYFSPSALNLCVGFFLATYDTWLSFHLRSVEVKRIP